MLAGDVVTLTALGHRYYLHSQDGRIIAATLTEEASLAARRLLRPEPK